MDIHGLFRSDAEDRLPLQICDYYEAGHKCFQIVHGFNQGTVLRNYVRRDLKRDIIKELGYECSVNVVVSDQGITVIFIS